MSGGSPADGRRPVTNAELFGTDGITRLANDLFLRAAMEATTPASMQLEVLLGYARAELLRLASQQGPDESVDADVVAFACALARQCFINEYVYAQADTENVLAGVLRDRLLQDLASGATITPLALAVVAAYVPLHALPDAHDATSP